MLLYVNIKILTNSKEWNFTLTLKYISKDNKNSNRRV